MGFDNEVSVDALRYYLSAVELGSFQAAAERLHVTPQAVGKAVALLESRLGPLLLRDKRLRGLTPAGRRLVSEARPVVEALAGLSERVRPSRQEPSGSVALGAPTSVAQYVLAPLCAQLCRRHPALQPQIFALDSAQVERRLLSSELELGVLSSPPESKGLQALPGPEMTAVIVASPTFAPGEWSDFAYILPTTLSGQSVDGWPEREFPRRAAALTNQLEVAVALAEAGLGATVAPRFAVQERLDQGRLQIVAPSPREITARLWMIHRSDQTLGPAARAVVEKCGNPGA